MEDLPEMVICAHAILTFEEALGHAVAVRLIEDMAECEGFVDGHTPIQTKFHGFAKEVELWTFAETSILEFANIDDIADVVIGHIGNLITAGLQIPIQHRID